jgi:primosomal protein N' (replication factor Y)
MRYNARDLAVVKARCDGATIILGSATPGMQTFFNAGNKKYRYLTLPDRAGERPLPGVEILDMRLLRDERGKPGILSPPLRAAIGETLKAGRQTLLFLNRRGFHTFVFCADCGHVLRCLNCSVSMTYHAGENILKCHYCDFAVKAPPICPACRGSRVRSYGMGTERLEEEISRAFPGARVKRMDSDSTARKGAQGKILQAFDKGEIDILVGTQMITKGHDYPGVLLVGVVMADASLNIPDFRASECTFQHLTQVAGRGGRGDDPGRVIIQTLNPEHYAIRLARNHDYLAVYEEEIVLRRALGYPPYSRMVKLNISSTKKERVEEGAKKIGEMAKTISGALAGREKVDVMGPAEAPIAKLKGRYRWHLILKGKNVGTLHGVVRDILAQNREKGLEIRVDVDPLNFM